MGGMAERGRDEYSFDLSFALRQWKPEIIAKASFKVLLL